MRLGNECVQVKAGSLMDKTVGQHMQALEQKLNLLNARIMDEKTELSATTLSRNFGLSSQPSRFIVRRLRLKNGL